MTGYKITCSQCGLDYLPQLINYYEEKAFCGICEMDQLVEVTIKEQEIYLPSYFLSNRHLRAFLTQLKSFSNISMRSSREVLSAYIHSIPALHQHPTIDMVVFDLFPFIWQFELIILEHSRVPGTDIKIKTDSKNRFEQTKFVKTLGSDLQVILYAAHLLTSNEIEPCLSSIKEIYKEVDTSQLSTGFSVLFEEMVRFYESKTIK
ncbi:hypothetical protein [Psychrobacillus sp. FSL H8-0487]|uniref:hypothetical protein n=1 Tax=Psychrobacillus sp. FSL H8-0487 TaxID=2921391 RepID=UPI0030F6370C